MLSLEKRAKKTVKFAFRLAARRAELCSDLMVKRKKKEKQYFYGGTNFRHHKLAKIAYVVKKFNFSQLGLGCIETKISPKFRAYETAFGALPCPIAAESTSLTCLEDSRGLLRTEPRPFAALSALLHGQPCHSAARKFGAIAEKGPSDLRRGKAGRARFF